MKRIAEWAVYVVGGLAIVYLALYAYAFFTRPHLQPGDPIRIFRKQDAPNYSAIQQRCLPGFPEGDGNSSLSHKGERESQAITPSPRRRDDRCCRRA